MSKSTDTDDVIVARCVGCNRVTFAAVNEPHVIDTEICKEIGKLVRSNRHTIEHMTTEQVRKAPFGCKCDEIEPTLGQLKKQEAK